MLYTCSKLQEKKERTPQVHEQQGVTKEIGFDDLKITWTIIAIPGNPTLYEGKPEKNYPFLPEKVRITNRERGFMLAFSTVLQDSPTSSISCTIVFPKRIGYPSTAEHCELSTDVELSREQQVEMLRLAGHIIKTTFGIQLPPDVSLSFDISALLKYIENNMRFLENEIQQSRPIFPKDVAEQQSPKPSLMESIIRLLEGPQPIRHQ